MSRILIPGRVDRHGIARPLPEFGDTELANETPLRAPFLVRPAITVHRISRARRLRRLLRAAWAFLIAPSFRG